MDDRLPDQHFHREVQSVVNANNVSINHQCPGPHACPHKTESWQHESDLQAEFAEKVGVWCPKPARLILGPLIGEFTPKELRLALKADSIFWSPKKNELVISTPTFQAVFGWGLVIYAALSAIAIGLSNMNLVKPKLINNFIALAVASLFFASTCWIAGRLFLWPRRIAIRVRDRLAKEASEAGNDG